MSMRARNIKPGFFQNELLGSADPLIGLLFLALPMLADREGRLEDKPAKIRALVFPYRDNVRIRRDMSHQCSDMDYQSKDMSRRCHDLSVDEMLDWLAGNDFVERYTVDGKQCINVKTFLNHQRPHPHEARSVLPPPPVMTCHGDVITSNVMSRHVIPMSGDVSLNPDSLNPSSLNPESGMLESRANAPKRGEPEPSVTEAETWKALDALKAAYPEFDGRADWLTALRSARSLVDAEEATFAELLAGVERYAAYVVGGGVSEARYVLTPVKFFGADDRPWSQPWTLTTKKPNGAHPPRDYAAEARGARVARRELAVAATTTAELMAVFDAHCVAIDKAIPASKLAAVGGVLERDYTLEQQRVMVLHALDNGVEFLSKAVLDAPSSGGEIEHRT